MKKDVKMKETMMALKAAISILTRLSAIPLAIAAWVRYFYSTGFTEFDIKLIALITTWMSIFAMIDMWKNIKILNYSRKSDDNDI